MTGSKKVDGPRPQPALAEPATPTDPGPASVQQAPETVRLRPDLRSDQEAAHEQAHHQLTGEGRIGDPGVDHEIFKGMGSIVRARHLMTLMAQARGGDRVARLDAIGALILGLDEARTIRQLLLHLPDAGRIVDIYPLEVLAWVLERAPHLLGGMTFGSVITNKPQLEARSFDVEETIHIKVPLSLKMRAFALVGGPQPGYCFQPGPPAAYRLEFGDPGEFTVMVRGEMRRKSVIDTVTLVVTEPPE